jgi:hypothetical protein
MKDNNIHGMETTIYSKGLLRTRKKKKLNSNVCSFFVVCKLYGQLSKCRGERKERHSESDID